MPAEHNTEERKLLSTEEMNNLPDEDFAYIEPGGEKDASGKTTPRSLRHYPVQDKTHALNALQRAEAQTKNDGPGKDIAEKAMPAILAACHKFGIDVGGNSEAKSFRADAADCSTCDGTGKIKAGTTTCPTCNGTGKQTDEAESKPRIGSVREPVPAAFRGDMIQVREERVPVRREFELREVPNGAGGTNLRFTGFACVTDARYEMEDWLGTFGETVSKGSFTKTLDEGADVAFLLNHQGMALARTKSGTMKLSEVTEPGLSPVIGVTGLHTEALLDAANPQIAAIRSAVERGDLDEMSFAFRVMRQEWNDDYSERYINEVSLDKGDTSLVNYGANPHTGGTVALRQRAMTRDRFDVQAVLAAAVAEMRAGKTISAQTAAKLQEAYPHLDSMGAAADGIKSMVDDLIAMNAPDPEAESAAPPDVSAALGWFRSMDLNADRARLALLRNRRAA
jgi:HK97 family phage prohead protease